MYGIKNMTTEQYKERKQSLNKRIKSVLTYVGTAVAIIFGLVYVGILVILIIGFSAEIDPQQQWLFVGLGGAIGLVIDISLMSQGIALAKNDDECDGVMKAYYEAKNKNTKPKKLHTVTYFIVKHIITTLFSKVLGAVASIYLIVHFVIVGTQDMTLLLLGIANLLMFTGFGIMSLAKAYDYYIEQHIPAIKERTRLLNQTPVGVRTDHKGA